MDTSALWLGVSALLILLVAVVGFIGVVWYYSKIGLAKGAMRSLLAVVLVVMIVGSLYAMGAFSSLLGTSVVSSGATYDISISEDMSHVTVDADDLVVTCNLDYNYTGDGTFANETQYALLNITLDRTDRGSSAETTTIEVTDVGSVADDADGTSNTLIAKGTSYNVNWTKAIDPGAATVQTITKRGLSTTLHVDAAGANWVLCNITWNGDAVDAMPAYQSEYVYISAGGNTITVEVHVINYLGTPPT